MSKRNLPGGRWKPQRNKSSLIVAFAAILLVFQAPLLDSARRIRIVTSVFPLMEFAQAVCGERGEVHLLVPPGAEIHTWQPRPSDIVRLSSSDLFIFIGSSMEPWLQDILDSVQNPNLRSLEASQGIPLIERDSTGSELEGEHEDEHAHETEAVDPHIWLDFQNDQIIIDKIAAVLSRLDPEGTSIFKKNASVYKQRLRALDEKFRESLHECTHKVFILGGHAAFGYMARRYGLRQISLYGVSPDSRPTPKKLIEVVELAKKYKIKVIFFESSVSDELARVLAREVGARILVLNPGANLTKEELELGKTFFDIMEENLENLKDGLVCR
ncbi:MAG: metal ABC transporter substrate-binding protein [Candidatus Aminicenantes bacterium]|jgi:zinc transport system substrate-binding protein